VVWPEAPVAVAVYVVVVFGLTDCVPPVDCKVYALPSVPLTITPVALVAETVRVAELPAVIDVGLAVMLTVGAGVALK
jgi:hypothetical protein